MFRETVLREIAVFGVFLSGFFSCIIAVYSMHAGHSGSPLFFAALSSLLLIGPRSDNVDFKIANTHAFNFYLVVFCLGVVVNYTVLSIFPEYELATPGKWIASLLTDDTMANVIIVIYSALFLTGSIHGYFRLNDSFKKNEGPAK